MCNGGGVEEDTIVLLCVMVHSAKGALCSYRVGESCLFGALGTMYTYKILVDYYEVSNVEITITRGTSFLTSNDKRGESRRPSIL